MSSRAVHSRNSYRDVNKNEDDFDSDSSTPDRFKNQININTSRSPSNGNHICDSKSNCNNININVSSTISNSYSHSCSHSYSHSHSHSHSQGNYQKKTLFQSKAQKHHPQQSNSTATLSLDDSRGDWSTGSIHVSKLTESGNRFRMIPSDSTKNSTTTTTTTASTSNHVNDNRSRGHGIPYASESGNVYSTNHAHSHGNVDYRTRNQSLASRSTVYHDAADVEERLHMHSEYNYQEYPCDATSQSNHYYPRHCEYEYGHGHGYMPESMNELSMPMQSQMQTNRQTSIQTPYDFNTPSKFATILAPDNKSIWYRLKEIFEGKEDACNPTEIPDGLFCNCIKAVNDSPDTPDWNQNGWFMNGNGNRNRSGNGSGNPSYKSYSESSDCNYDEAVVQHHYMSFKDVDVDADVDVDVEQRSSSSHHSSKWNPNNGNIKTVKRKNSNVVSNRQSDIDHGNAYRLPRHNVSHELEHKLEHKHKHKHEHELEQGYSLVNLGEVVNLSPEDFDSNQYQYDTFSKYTPLNTERESRRRLFSVPGGLYASEDDSPDSIPPIESPMSDMASVYHIANDLDSYAGDADTVTNLDIRDRFNSDFYSLPGNTELKHDDVPEFNPIRATMEKKGPARLHIDNSTDKKNNYNYSGMNNINTISSKPRLGNRQSSTVVNPASPISPMNTIGTQGTMHRRVNSTCTFTVNSFALIFDQNEQSPKKSTKIPIVPKTVKTVKKKSRNGNDGFDDISPLDDNEDSRLGLRSFRERMNEIDCAIDDDAACSPIQRQKQKSFDFSQNPIAVDLFGKENADPKTGISTYKSMASSNLCGNAVEKTLPEVHIANDPDGVYLPVTSFFKEEENPKHSECSFEGWVAYSKQTQSKDGLIQYIQQKNKLKRKHLRYIIVRGDQMYVHASKSSSEESVAGSSYTDDSKSTHMKVLKLSKHMSIEVKDVSRQHGKSIIVKDSRLIGMRKSDIVCTMLPVRLTSAFFKDESCSEVVGSREFDLALETTKMFGQKAACSRPALLPANGVKECITPHPHNKSNMKAAEWPRTLSETVPIEQNTAALFMQFALDAAMRGKVSSKNS